MHLSTSLKVLALGGLTAVFSVGAVSDADAQQRIRWKMHNDWSASVPFNGDSAIRFVDNVTAMSEGKFEIKNFEPGALVPALQCFDAASKGSVEACWTTPGYHAGKIPALSFFTAVPFGPQLGEYMAWKMYGGGDDLRNEIYKEHNLIAIDNFSHGPETSGWFREEIKSVDEMKGKKMRFFGLGAEVMAKIGVSTQLLAAGDIFPALERGVIDATEYSMPANDIKLGFYQIAKYNYFPGWHQQVSVSELLMNRAKWEELPKQYQKMIEMACAEGVIRTYADSEFKNPGALNELKEKHGVHVMRWSDQDLAVFEKAWKDIVEERSAKDPIFKKIADSYFSFRERYRTWGASQQLQSTYLD